MEGESLMNLTQFQSGSAPLSGQQQQGFGQVQAVTKHGYLVQQHQAGTLLMKKAFSCAFTPLVGDQVSFLKRDNGQHYILHILEREQETPAIIESEHGIQISSPEQISLQSETLDIINIKTQLTNETTQAFSKNINVQADQTSLKTRILESLAERSMQKFKDSFRMIERMEQTTAKDVINNIKNVFVQRSKNADISAKGDIKINGDRIHMG